jgi:hypothetical protein
LEEVHWEVPPHPAYCPDLAPSDFHLFDLLKKALGGKRFRADDEVKFFSTMTGRATINLKGHNEVVRAMVMVYRDRGKISGKQVFLFENYCE